MENRLATSSSSLIFNRYILIILAIAIFGAAWGRQYIIVVLLGLILSAGGLALLWSRWSLKGVTCRRDLSDLFAFPGESIDLKLKLVNRKLLPLPWIQVAEEIPAGFAPDLNTPETRPGRRLFVRSASMLWYSASNWRQPLRCHKRGYYQLGPTEITSGDIFGFFPRTMTLADREYVTVYPRIFTISELSIPPVFPLGDSQTDRRIFADPTRINGVRDYTSGDSLRHIHWKATARRGDLQVKVFEPTTTLDAAIFLSIDSFRFEGSMDFENLELGISAAASLASYINEQRSSVGMYANAILADETETIRIHPGSGPGQLMRVLAALAKVTSNTSVPFTDFFQTQRYNLPWGTTLVFIIGNAPGPFSWLIDDLEANGYKLMVLQAGNQPAENRPNWHHVDMPDAIRQEVAGL